MTISVSSVACSVSVYTALSAGQPSVTFTAHRSGGGRYKIATSLPGPTDTGYTIVSQDEEVVLTNIAAGSNVYFMPATHTESITVEADNGLAGSSAVVDITFSVDTAAYATGDVLADTQVITNVLRIADGTGIIQGITVIDEDDQGQALDIVFLSANNSLGTENAAVSITDAASRDILGMVSIGGADFVDLGGSRVASKDNLGLLIKSIAGTRSLGVAAISRGTGTYTASGIKIRLDILLD